MLDDLMLPPQMSEKTKDLQGVSFDTPRKPVKKTDSEPKLNQIKDVQGVEQWRVDQIKTITLPFQLHYAFFDIVSYIYGLNSFQYCRFFVCVGGHNH